MVEIIKKKREPKRPYRFRKIFITEAMKTIGDKQRSRIKLVSNSQVRNISDHDKHSDHCKQQNQQQSSISPRRSWRWFSFLRNGKRSYKTTCRWTIHGQYSSRSCFVVSCEVKQMAPFLKKPGDSTVSREMKV
jgi:hypothetical protein